MTHDEREELMRRISVAWREGYRQGIADSLEEAEAAGCGHHLSKLRTVWELMRHPFHGGVDKGAGTE